MGVNRIQDRVPELAQAYIDADHSFDQMDEAVLTDPDVSELGRFAVTEDLDGIGAFKTSTVRNVTVTGPYMHDGSLATLEEVVTHYNNGGVTNEDDPVNDFLAGGIRPLNLTDAEQAALVAFMEALTSPEHAPTTEE